MLYSANLEIWWTLNIMCYKLCYCFEMKTSFKTNIVKRHGDTQTHDLPTSIFPNI